MKKLIAFIILITSTILLSGCIAVVAGAGGTAGYLIAKDKGKVGTYTSDSIITNKIKAHYLGESSIKSLDISVTTNRGIVTLTGDVTSPEVRHLAIRIAERTKGVRGVVADHLYVD